MAKGKRKRSNKDKKIEKQECPTGACDIKSKTTIYEKYPVKTLSQDDANHMKEIFEMSNNVSALIRDYATKDITITSMRKTAKEIEKQKEPLMIQVAKNVYKTERDYKKLAKSIRDQANKIEKQLVLLDGQIAHRYEDYVASLIRHKRFVENVIKSAKIKTITGHRSDNKTKKDEEIVFEKEFEDMTDADIEKLKKLNSKIKKSLDKKKEKDNNGYSSK